MRVEGKCAGDCSKCELLEQGKVDMIPCILDQLFQRVQRLEKNIVKKEGELANLANYPETNE